MAGQIEITSHAKNIAIAKQKGKIMASQNTRGPVSGVYSLWEAPAVHSEYCK